MSRISAVDFEAKTVTIGEKTARFKSGLYESHLWTTFKKLYPAVTVCTDYIDGEWIVTCVGPSKD